MRSLKYQLAIIPSLRFVLLVTVFSYIFVGLWNIWEFGNAIDVTGRQIILSQMLVKNITLELDLQSGNAKEQIESLKYLKDNFEKNLHQQLKRESEKNLVKRSHKRILTKLEQAVDFWGEFKIPVEKIIHYRDFKEKQIDDFVSEVVRSEYELYITLNQLTIVYKQESARSLQNVLVSLLSFLVLEILFFFLSWLYTSRWVTRPLNYVIAHLDKRKTIDDLREDICFPVNNEIGIMIHSINEASRHILKITRELEVAYEKAERACQNLKETQVKLIQSEKLASLGQLAAGVAHEINNPTGYILSNLNSLSQYSKDISAVLREQEELESDLRRCAGIPGREEWQQVSGRVKTIELMKQEIDLNFVISDLVNVVNESVEGASRIQEIVSELKSFSYFDKGAFASEDVHDCINSAMTIVWNEIKFRAKVKKEYGEIPRILCNATQIKQVIMNLLVNAAQSIERDGAINIRTFKTNKSACVEISDNGSGIPQEIRSKIFDPFFTTKEVGKGTGLGLNISYNIVKNHGGEIQLKSVVGHGSTFTISLPLVNEKAHSI